jgi:hypothetical protein
MASDGRQLLGRVEVSIFVPASWDGGGLGLDADVEIAVTDVDPRVSEDSVVGWALDELAGLLPSDDD